MTNCDVRVTGGELPQEEIQAYIDRAEKKFGARPHGIDIKVDGDFVELAYDFGNMPFQRIRRITGYLVGTLDWLTISATCPSSASGASPATWWAPWTASTTPSGPRSTTV